jgi:transcriptional regulator
MYVPDHFQETDLARLDWLVSHDAFATLISIVDGAPFVSHLPVLYRRDDQQVRFAGHWARPNPQWRAIESQRVLLIIHGPHTYISPRWYVEPRRQVPTWNYCVAHVYGKVRLITDEAALEQIVSALAARYEVSGADAWKLATSEPGVRSMLRSIVGFELAADEVQLKFKLSQNHPRGNVEGAIVGLRSVPSDDARAVMTLMQDAPRNTGSAS